MINVPTPQEIANAEAEKYQREIEEKKRKAELSPKELENLVNAGLNKGAELNLNIYPEAKEKLENVENPSEIIDSLKDALIEKYAEEGLELRKEDLKNKEDFDRAVENLKVLRNKGKKAPSGNVPLRPIGYEPESDTQSLIDYEGSVLDLSFNDQNQMITVLKKRAENGDAESQECLQELLNKLNIKEKGEEWVYEGSAKDMANRKNKWKKKER